MTTAFVLSGGGSLGAVQVGMLIALAEREVVADLVVGTSVGAINAAWISGRPGLDGALDLADVWRSVHRKNVFPTRPLAGLRGFLGSSNYLVPPGALRKLLSDNLVFERLEDAPIPVIVVATEITTGCEVVLNRGDAVDVVVASAAIPGVFPPVAVEGHRLVDGGVTDNAPIRHAVDAGASTIYVLPTGYPCALAAPPRGALGMILHAVTLLVQRQLTEDVRRFQDSVDLRLVPPPCPLEVSPADFSHTDELIRRAHDIALRWLDRPDHPTDQSAMLAMHRHSADELATQKRRLGPDLPERKRSGTRG